MDTPEVLPPPRETIGKAMSNLAQVLDHANRVPIIETSSSQINALGLPIPGGSETAPSRVHTREYLGPAGARLISAYDGLSEETRMFVRGELAVRRSANASQPVSDEILRKVDAARVAYQPYALRPTDEPPADSGVRRGEEGAIEYVGDALTVRYEPVGAPLAEPDTDANVFWGGRNWRETIQIGADTPITVEGTTLLAFQRLADPTPPA